MEQELKDFVRVSKMFTRLRMRGPPQNVSYNATLASVRSRYDETFDALVKAKTGKANSSSV